MCFSVQCVREIHSFLSIPMSEMHRLSLCVTLFNKHPEIIGMELYKCRYEEEDGAVCSVELPSLLPYNAWTTADYSGLTNNILSFQLVPYNIISTPALLGFDLLMHMSTYLNQYMEVDEASGVPTTALDVRIGQHQIECIQLTIFDVYKGRIIANDGVQV